ncbi:MAG: class I SAM-dependent methyltransferase [Verrucomicrobiaceae bacterium]|nr:class I SAM-dependent methyltransferase [Verrucomicrobiaceae bacterium]
MNPGQATGEHEEEWYDLPLYYDIIFDQDTARETDFLEEVFRLHAGRDFRKQLDILEPACGSGRLMHRLMDMGHSVVGFDLSLQMVEFSRDRLSQAGHSPKVFALPMERFSIPGQFDMAFCLVSTFKYLLTEGDARSHLRAVGSHLRSGGIYVIGLHLSDYPKSQQQRECWSGSRGDVHVDCIIDSDAPDPRSRIEKLQSRLKIRDHAGIRTINTSWDFRTYDAPQLKTLLESVPSFTLEGCYDFCYDVNEPRELDSPWEDVILVLKKK